MKVAFQHLLPQDFTPQSRVWVYQSSRLFTINEAMQIESLLEEFIQNWTSHGADVKAYGNLFFGQFIILMADETKSMISGCSTDSSVRFIKNIEQLFGVDLFNRTSLAFIIKDKVQLLPLSQVNYAFENNFINAETLFFNNVVQTKEALENSWIIPIKDSWLANRLKLQSQ